MSQLAPCRSVLLSSSNSGFGGFFTDDFFHTPMITPRIFGGDPIFSKASRDPFMIVRKSSPGHEIIDNPEHFQVALDVPGVKMADIDIEIREHDRVLRISGNRKINKTDKDGTVSMSESNFEKSFVMDETVDTTKITANLEDGVLTINAPKDANLVKDKTTKIAITEGGGKI